METFETKGFSSVKVVLKNGEVIVGPTIRHKFPERMSAEEVDIEHIERELTAGMEEILKEVNSDGPVGFFIEYSPEACKKAP